jgi:2-polyprenyl-3-methyl-5-hydroxy-6-metoxy-1,4-benzoquinol methylase
MPNVSQALSLAKLLVLRRLRQTRDPNFIGFDKYAKHGAYHWDELAHNGDYRAKADFIRSHSEPGYDVLDLGCGDGAYLFQLSPHVRSLVGIDADFDAIRLAEHRLSERGVSNARVVQTPLSRVDGAVLSRGRGFDLAYSMDVIEHLPEPSELLDAANRATKPGGLIIIGTPLFVREELVSPYHVKEFTRDEVSALIRSRLTLEHEHVMSERRSDGRIYDAFYIATARPKSY